MNDEIMKRFNDWMKMEAEGWTEQSNDQTANKRAAENVTSFLNDRL